MKEGSAEKIISRDEAMAEINFIMQECSVMGANDSEIPTLNRLIKEIEAEEIEPAEALRQAYEIRNSKQDYH